jgi:hypothetical protein
VVRVDLLDSGDETALWSAAEVIVKTPPGPHAKGDRLTGVFTFAGESAHGVFDARIAQLDDTRGLMGAAFEWINEPGARLLKAIAGRRTPGQLNHHPKMTLGFAHVTLNWSFTGFLLDAYHGPLEAGQRFRGMIWMDMPEDPGLFDAHVIRTDRQRHTLSAKFDALPPATFALLEAVMHKRGRRVSGMSPE